LDERILEYLSKTKEELTPWMIADGIDARTGFVRYRCRVLGNAGLVYRRSRDDLPDKFGLSVWGRLYLLGDVDADLRRPVPGPRPPHAVRPGWWAGFG
jgi:hypothetical protein